MMKTVWIVNYYTNIPEKISNPRHYEFAKYLTGRGYFVRIFFADRKRIPEKDAIISRGRKFVNEEHEGIQYTRIAAMPYDGNVKRGISIWKFAWTIFCLRRQFEVPDVILFNMHAPFDYPIVWTAKLLHSRLISECWDLWPEGFIIAGLLKANNPLVKLFYQIERLIYQKADAIVFTFEGGIEYLKVRGWLKGWGGNISPQKISYINNGVNLALFEEYRKKYPTTDVDLLRDDIIKVVYLGSIQLVNQVKDLIDAAEILKNKNNIKFIIIGDGSDRPMLEQYCKDRGINNVLFKQKHVPFCEVADIVSHASINVMNYQNYVGSYGISSGKMFLYFAAGQPICCNVKLNYCEITKNNLGIAINLDNPQKYAEAILTLSQLTVFERENIQKRMKDVVQKYDYSYLSSKIEKLIEQMIH